MKYEVRKAVEKELILRFSGLLGLEGLGLCSHGVDEKVESGN